MEFTENFRKSNNFRIDGQMLYVIDSKGVEIQAARWSDEGRLIVALKSGAVRSYENEVTFIKI